ncbi:hypothetical protein CK203_080937 [Vitis vinifera]|uniref:Uncharacterized protein n=1 Tax=Vitis vinifera TaxID=29760 RepID=A0A438EMT6_VITVI|nr:hypothetical protein CK203_080937 [Vitis vinifera]
MVPHRLLLCGSPSTQMRMDLSLKKISLSSVKILCDCHKPIL